MRPIGLSLQTVQHDKCLQSSHEVAKQKCIASFICNFHTHEGLCVLLKIRATWAMEEPFSSTRQ